MASDVSQVVLVPLSFFYFGLTLYCRELYKLAVEDPTAEVELKDIIFDVLKAAGVDEETATNGVLELLEMDFFERMVCDDR